MPSRRQMQKRINEARESAWRPITVYADGAGSVEKRGMAEIFKNEHDLADGMVEVPEDVVILDDGDIPGAAPVTEG